MRRAGSFTEAVRRRPYTVVLLDEIEKAHPESIRHPAAGARRRPADRRPWPHRRLRNTILILTSNLGSTYLIDPTIEQEQQRELVLGAVRAAFKPEFLEPLDEVVVFDALSTDDLAQIVDLQVGLMAKRLAGRRLTLEVSPDARDWLARTGYDPAYGARPLRRLIQSAIGDQLAKALLAGEIRDGGAVGVDLDQGGAGLTVRAA